MENYITKLENYNQEHLLKYIDFYSWFYLIDRDAHGVDVAGTEDKVKKIYASLDELETQIIDLR